MLAGDRQAQYSWSASGGVLCAMWCLIPLRTPAPGKSCLCNGHLASGYWINFVLHVIILCLGRYSGICIGAFTLGLLFSSVIGRRHPISLLGAICCMRSAFVTWIVNRNLVIYYMGHFVAGFGYAMDCMVIFMCEVYFEYSARHTR